MDLMRLSVLLLIVGGLNWGSVGLLGKDLVAGLLGARSMAARAVYVAVGLAAVYVAASYFGVLEGFENAMKDYASMSDAQKKAFCAENPKDTHCAAAPTM
jgi:uncharacterized membrane protein YuzA (DUF378 family)